MNASWAINPGLSFYSVITPAIFTDIQPPWERGGG
jgi:hypothetical protein